MGDWKDMYILLLFESATTTTSTWPEIFKTITLVLRGQIVLNASAERPSEFNRASLNTQKDRMNRIEMELSNYSNHNHYFWLFVDLGAIYRNDIPPKTPTNANFFSSATLHLCKLLLYERHPLYQLCISGRCIS